MYIKNNNSDNPSNAEIIYHIFQRSFFDSDNDKHGDLNGLRQKLDYLQDLGITSILLTPLYRSAYYHNYFADDFESIDPVYGTAESYFALVREIHNRGMKIYMDMEIQYITEDHVWYKDAYENPSSPFSEYLLYKDEDNKIPETIIFDINGVHGYDAVYRNITTVNLHNKKVQDYMYRLFSYWADPGNATEGVDGFRLDHMMDTLDNKKRLSNLFEAFWKPLINKLKQVHPQLIFIAEQTDWNSFGEDYIQKSGADRVFAFPLREAILGFEKEKMAQIAETTFNIIPGPSQNIVFIENHDTQRFATHVLNDPVKLRTGAVLNLLLAGTPAIYYGQELGMKMIFHDAKHLNGTKISIGREWLCGTKKLAPGGRTATLYMTMVFHCRNKKMMSILCGIFINSLSLCENQMQLLPTENMKRFKTIRSKYTPLCGIMKIRL